MPVYSYVSVDKSGKKHRGMIEGDSSRYIRQTLREKGLLTLEVSIMDSETKQGKKVSSLFSRGISKKHLTFFTCEFSTLLSSGLTIEESLSSIGKNTKHKYFKGVLLNVHQSVREGQSLAAAMQQYDNVFPTLYRASISAGEQSGQLDNVLNRLADFLEKQQKIQNKLFQSLLYPIMLTLVSIAIVVFLMIYAVPKIIGIFTDTGQQLPFITEVLINSSVFLKSYGLIILTGLIIALVVFCLLIRHEHIKFKVQLFILKIPGIGSFIGTINTTRFSRTLGILIGSGVPLIDAMQSAAAVVSNLPIKKAIINAIKVISEGQNVSASLEATGYFSDINIQLIASGERSGQLDQMLQKTADYQENYLNEAINTGLSLFEPLMILFMGLVVLFIVLAILLPIFEINQFIGVQT